MAGQRRGPAAADRQLAESAEDEHRHGLVGEQVADPHAGVVPTCDRRPQVIGERPGHPACSKPGGSGPPHRLSPCTSRRLLPVRAHRGGGGLRQAGFVARDGQRLVAEAAKHPPATSTGESAKVTHEGDHDFCWLREALTASGLRLVEVDSLDQAELAQLRDRYTAGD